jgi:hypothetical protein
MALANQQKAESKRGRMRFVMDQSRCELLRTELRGQISSLNMFVSMLNR